jgi:hypothetical protein
MNLQAESQDLSRREQRAIVLPAGLTQTGSLSVPELDGWLYGACQSWT